MLSSRNFNVIFQFLCNRNERMNEKFFILKSELRWAWILLVRYVGSLPGPAPITENFHSPPCFEDMKIRSTDVEKQLQEEHSSTWFSFPEMTSKQTNSCLFKIYFRSHSWVKISSNKATCVFICFLCDIMHFVLRICTNKSAFEFFCFTHTFNCSVSIKAGRSSLLHHIKRSYRFLPQTKLRQRKYSYGRQ